MFTRAGRDARGARAATWRPCSNQWGRAWSVRAHPRSRTRASHGGRWPARRRRLSNKNALHRKNASSTHQAGTLNIQAIPHHSQNCKAEKSWVLCVVFAYTTTPLNRVDGPSMTSHCSGDKPQFYAPSKIVFYFRSVTYCNIMKYVYERVFHVNWRLLLEFPAHVDYLLHVGVAPPQ